MNEPLIDVAYGPHERQRLDVYFQDRTKKPAPAIIYLHGGGYMRGDKALDTGYLELIKEQCFPLGINVISANYRFITTHPYPAPMQDGTRIIQFVRSKAEEWNIDPSKIALSGGSAGAHIALWNAFKEDQSDLNSTDPVQTFSSSVSAAIVFESQVSKDQRFYDEYYMGDQLQPNITTFFGIESPEQLHTKQIQQLAYDASAINFVTETAPPVLCSYRAEFTEPIIPADEPIGKVIHHPVHGYVLKNKMEALGIRCIFKHKGNPLQRKEIGQFLQDHLS